MKMYKSYVFRMYPNKEQIELICKTFGCTRFVYNYYLDKKKKEYEINKKTMTCFETIKGLSIREYECPKCKRKHDRDINYSINIMFEGIKEYMKSVA